MGLPAQGQLPPLRPDLPVELCQPIIELRLFLNQPFSGDAALLQGGHSVHVLGKLRLHAGQSGLIELFDRGQGLRIRQSGVKRPAPLPPHIEDGALLHQVGQRLLCAGGEGRHVRPGRDAVVPEEGKLFPVLLKAHDLLPELGRHAGWVLPLADLPQ